MNVSLLSKEFFRVIDERIGPFDRPFQFQVFPFDAGGALNFLTVGVGRGEPFVIYVTWDLFGHEQQKRGSFGRYELLATCDDDQWCSDVLTKIGRLGLQELFEPGDTLDIGQWVSAAAPIQGVVFEDAFSTELLGEPCGLLRCIGVTRPELEFAMKHGTPALIERLDRAHVYPHTMIDRKESIELAT
ncbi:MAG: suppressor of fused domain protein [Verrucomicrobia bacterium]|nr:suppressor of fused domain protein [Verrucomicrobiota bacterium]